MNTILKLALLALLVSFRAAGAQEIQVGIGLVCDEAAQVARFLHVVNDDMEAAVKQVNEETKSENACVLDEVAFVVTNEGETVRNKEGTWKVVEILVVGIGAPGGLRQVVPMTFYTAIKASGQEV